MSMEFKTRYCPQCDEDIQAEREAPSGFALLGPRYIAQMDGLLGRSSEWKCSQCGAAIPVDPEERKRQIALAIWISLPLLLGIVLVLIVLAKRWLGGEQ